VETRRIYVHGDSNGQKKKENARFPSEDGNASCLRLLCWTRVLAGPHSFFPNLTSTFFHGQNLPDASLRAQRSRAPHARLRAPHYPPPPSPALPAASDPLSRCSRRPRPTRNPTAMGDWGKVVRNRRRPPRTKIRGGPFTRASSPVPTTATPPSFSVVPHPWRFLPEMERMVGSDLLRGRGDTATFLLRLRAPCDGLVRPRASQGISRSGRASSLACAGQIPTPNSYSVYLVFRSDHIACFKLPPLMLQILPLAAANVSLRCCKGPP
jgi:hypothetical protein